MKITYVHVFAAFLLFITACPNRNNSEVPNVAEITYRETSGAVSPDVAWSELYTVSSAGLTFARTGYSALTTVNTGTWTINSYGANEAKLFSDLSGADVYGVVKTGQGTAPTGGGIKDYTIRYDNGNIREVIVGDGSIYNNAGLILTPINNYIANITLPVGASKRYKSVQMGGAIQGNPLTLSSLVTTLAGTAWSPGFSDGTGTSGQFESPSGITTDGSNLYVADKVNNAIRKIVISTGVVTTITGTKLPCGSTDGSASTALFCLPSGITTDGTNLYVADTYNNNIRKINISSGDVTTLAGQAGWSGVKDGIGTDARFFFPYGITTDGTNLYVADTYNNTIRKVVIESRIVSTLTGSAGVSGSTDGSATIALFNRPTAITTDGTNLYVADTDNYTVRKVVISTGAVTTLAGIALNSGHNDGIGANALFWTTGSITTDGINLYVTDTPGIIRKIVISSREVTTLAGSETCNEPLDGTGPAACFNYPRGITTDGTSLYINDSNSNIVRKLQ